MTATTRSTRLKPRLVRRDPRLLTRLPVNARYMTKEEYDRLVENVRADGCLTSVPSSTGPASTRKAASSSSPGTTAPTRPWTPVSTRST